MFVYDGVDVSLEGASFSECTGDVRLPRPHTLASPAHARSHAIAAGEEGRGSRERLNLADVSHVTLLQVAHTKP